MKRYLSAILIPCLLLQLCGCYFQKEITLEELMLYKDEEITIMGKDSVKYLLKKDITSEKIIRESKTNYCIGADTTEKDLILYKKAVNKNTEQKITMKIDTVKIKKTNIVSIQKSELDDGDTALLVLVIIAGVAIIVGAILYEPVTVDLSGMKID